MNHYKNFTPEEKEELLANYLLDSWSYSKVSAFAGNEKAFEMQYIYRVYGKSGASTIAGQAYHNALSYYFQNLKDGVETDLIALEGVAFMHIDNVPAYYWKVQKTTPTIEECKIKATELASNGLKNFLAQIAMYTEDMKEVIGYETSITAWLTINGVDIPMPCHMAIDLIIRTNDNKIVIIDHKLKGIFTDDKELKFTIGKQAITYVLGYEDSTGQTVDEVWFIENKYSQNKDKSPQLRKHVAIMNAESRRLYEALLYEPLKKMISAVGDPDYVYMINDRDNLTDTAEIYDFWARTMIAEVEDFNVPDNKKELVRRRMKKIRDVSLVNVTPNVIRNFKTFTEEFIPYDFSNKNMTNQEKIEHILRSFGIVAKVQHVFDGYSSASYLLEISAGVQISSIQRYKLDIANALNVSNVRINKDLFVYQGKSYLLIESGRKNISTLIWDSSKLVGHKIPIGVDNFGETIFWDMDNNSTPHLLVGGATGSGKSVFLKSTIEYALLAGVNDVYIFDPKHEFGGYSSAVTVVNNIEDIETQMGLLVLEMEERVKNHSNKKTLVIFDEFADAVANSRKGNALKNYSHDMAGKKVLTGIDKSLEENLRLLLQKGRSSGFRIIAATQRASTKVITGDSKVNLPVQVCFRVPKDIDSMVMIDETGAEALGGRGDFLCKSPEYLHTVRGQGFYKE